MTETGMQLPADASAADERLVQWPAAPQQGLFSIAAFPKVRRL
jgi:hypothetical protein